MEVRLAKALWTKGYRYRKNSAKVYGKPDLVFTKYKVAVFVDSEYFHGKDWRTQKHRIKTNREFWWKKIEANKRRDKEVVKKLTENGWKVLRFWSLDVKKNLEFCLLQIDDALRSHKWPGTQSSKKS